VVLFFSVLLLCFLAAVTVNKDEYIKFAVRGVREVIYLSVTV